MKIQAFIFNWPGKKQHATKLEALFSAHCETIVINSDDTLRTRHPHWQHIGDDGYFTDQWNAALDRFNADIFLHIQADLWPTKVGKVLSEGERYMTDYNVGVYAPNVDFNPHIYRRQWLRKLDKGVYEVPATDNSYWAIRSEIVRNMPRVDPRVNRLGWGIEYLVSAVARRSGFKVVRDYRFTAGHLKKRGYDNEQASTELAELKNTLDGELYENMRALEQERDRLVIHHTWQNPLARVLTAVRSRASRGALILRRRVLEF
jgi:hypothetical protein